MEIELARGSGWERRERQTETQRGREECERDCFLSSMFWKLLWWSMQKLQWKDWDCSSYLAVYLIHLQLYGQWRFKTLSFEFTFLKKAQSCSTDPRGQETPEAAVDKCSHFPFPLSSFLLYQRSPNWWSLWGPLYPAVFCQWLIPWLWDPGLDHWDELLTTKPQRGLGTSASLQTSPSTTSHHGHPWSGTCWVHVFALEKMPWLCQFVHMAFMGQRQL